jgi:hypothetical protein
MRYQRINSITVIVLRPQSEPPPMRIAEALDLPGVNRASIKLHHCS